MELRQQLAGREKTPFSIWRKIQNKKISLEQLTDIIGFRVIVKTIEDCYKTLGVFHSKFSTIPGKFKDYISTPKINKYKSIHTQLLAQEKIELKFKLEHLKCMNLQKEVLHHIGNINHQKNFLIYLGKNMTG